MHQKKSIVAGLLILALFASAFYLSRKDAVLTAEPPRNPTSVSVQSGAESQSLTEKRTYPGTVEGVQEVAIISQISGVITHIPYEVGSPVKKGSLLARIDDSGALLAGEAGFRSNAVQQSELSAQQAKKSYGLSKDAYDSAKRSDASTKLDKETAKTQKEIAKLQYEAAKIGLQSAIDNRQLSSPIGGYIISKNVSTGDSVSPGQVIATVSATSAVKIRFYVDQAEKNLFSPGQEISVFGSDKKHLAAIVKNVAIQAEPQTKRFLVEAYPKVKNTASLLLGTIVSASLEKKQLPQDGKNFLLPLSAITITQNENFIFVAENDMAKKMPISLVRIIGENAEISAPLSQETLIIVKGNKVLREGEVISIDNRS